MPDELVAFVSTKNKNWDEHYCCSRHEAWKPIHLKGLNSSMKEEVDVVDLLATVVVIETAVCTFQCFDSVSLLESMSRVVRTSAATLVSGQFDSSDASFQVVESTKILNEEMEGLEVSLTPTSINQDFVDSEGRTAVLKTWNDTEEDAEVVDDSVADQEEDAADDDVLLLL
jgi:hypothetical protein